MLIATWNVNCVKARLETVARWLKEASPDVALPAGDQMPGRGVPAPSVRGAGLQCRAPRPEELQRRRHPLETSARGRPARPAGRRRRRSGALSRGGGLDRRRRRSASPRSTCPTAIRSARRNSPTSSPGWTACIAHAQRARSSRGAARAGRRLQRHPRAARCARPEAGSATRCSSRRRAAKFRELAQSRLHRRVARLHRRGRAYTFWDYQAGAWQQQQRHPHRPSAAVAAGRRPARAARIDKHVRGWDKPPITCRCWRRSPCSFRSAMLARRLRAA